MAFKIVLSFCAVVAVAQAGILAPAQIAYTNGAPLAYASAPTYNYNGGGAFIGQQAAYANAAPYAYAPVAKLAVASPAVAITKAAEEYDPNPQYSFAYDIQDGLTGDSKSQQETRNGDVVSGSYSLIDADGLKRTVEYTADPLNGFNAVVHREPIGVATKVVAAAPQLLAAKIAQPIARIAPAAYTTQYAQAAPAIAHYAAAPAGVVYH